jgi:hypothetical protein
MRHSISIVGGLMIVAVLAAACSAWTQSPPAPSQPWSGSTASTAHAAPPAPTGFVLWKDTRLTPCPDSGDTCHAWDLKWWSSADPGTWFRIYITERGGSPDRCRREAATVDVVETRPGERVARYSWSRAVGLSECFWITAVNGGGESAKVLGLVQVYLPPSSGLHGD